MSGPHRPGWSDEELIALSDLHISRQAMAAVPQQRSSGRQAQPNGRPTPRQQQQQPPANARQSQRPTAHREQSDRQQPNPDRQRRDTQPVRLAARQAPVANSTTMQNRVATQVAETVNNLDASVRKMLSGASSAPVSEHLMRQIRYPLHGATVGVFSRKGGVGKSTVTAYLALTFATIRDGHTIAIDGDHEDGSLGWLLAPEAPSTLEQLAAVQPAPFAPQEFARYISRTMVGLDVILNDPAHETSVDPAGLGGAIKNLSRNYDISVFDTGSATLHSAGRTLLNRSRVHLVVTGPSVDSVRAAERTLTWLTDREDARPTPVPVVVVINGIPSHLKTSQIEHIEEVFAGRCAAVVRIPWDEHLAEGTTSASIEQLSKPAQIAYQHLAATTVHVLARSMTRSKGLINQ